MQVNNRRNASQQSTRTETPCEYKLEDVEGKGKDEEGKKTYVNIQNYGVSTRFALAGMRLQVVHEFRGSSSLG